MYTLFKKEISNFLSSLTGYIAIIVFLVITGMFLWVFHLDFNILDFGYANIDGLFLIAPFIFLFLIPAITMRMFADENRSGTIEVLLTLPLSDLQIILAKYFAALIIVVFSLIPTFIYFISVYQLGLPPGNIDMGGMWGSYLGLLFLGSAFVSIGLFSSSFSNNQIISFIIAAFLSGFFYIGFELIYSFDLFGKFDLFIKTLGISEHYSSMSRGVIDTRDVIYFLSIIALFLLLTKISLEIRKRKNLIPLLLGLAIIILVNIISSFVFTRFDLTTEKRYSLSEATKDLLKEVDDIVYFKVYLEGDFPAGFKRLRRETKETLDEYRAYNKNIQYEFINPSASEDIQTRKSIYEQLVNKGLNPTDLQVKSKGGMSKQIIFPGAIVSYKGKELPLQLLISQVGVPPEEVLNNSLQGLEFNISNTIRNLTVNKRPKIAFIEDHGELKDIDVYDITLALQDYYDVERVRIGGKINSLTRREESDSGNVMVKNRFDAIIIAKPDSAFSDKDKFIIDQYIMNGGRVLWLIDPVFASMDSLQRYNETVSIRNDLNLDDLLFKYGIRLNDNLIMDLNALPIPLLVGHIGDQPQFEYFPWYFFPVITPMQEHPIVKNLNTIKTEFISSIDTVITPGIKKTILLTTSPYSRTVNAPSMISLQILREKPDERLYNGPEQIVGVLLEGQFESMYTHIIPPEIANDKLIAFKAKSPPTKMIVISDGDIIRNQLHMSKGYPLPLGFDQYTNETFGNKELIMNAVNYLTDDTGLISIRSRELKLRLLDKTKYTDSKIKWQLINILIPIVIIIMFGIFYSRIRSKRYGNNGSI